MNSQETTKKAIKELNIKTEKSLLEAIQNDNIEEQIKLRIKATAGEIIRII